MIDDGATVARLSEESAIVPPVAASDDPAVSSVDVYALTIDPYVARAEYVAPFLNSPVGRALTVAFQTGCSGQQHLYSPHFADVPIPIPRDASGQPDLGWQAEVIGLAEARETAVSMARATADELDAEFVARLGVPVDLSIIPF